MSQYNAQFNLQSNVAQVMGQINTALSGLNTRLGGLEGKAKAATGPVNQLAGGIEKINQNIGTAAQGVKDLAEGMKSLGRTTIKMGNIAQGIEGLNNVFTKSAANNVKTYASAMEKLAAAMKDAAGAARVLSKAGVRMGGGGGPGLRITTAGGGGGGIGPGSKTGARLAPKQRPGVAPGNIAGAMQPERSLKSARALMQLGSAAQGAAIGMSLLERNMMGVVFGLVFLQFGVTSTIALFAALTVAIGGTMIAATSLIALLAKAGAVGMEFERSGQQIASFFRSGDFAVELKHLSDEISRTFGIAHEETDKLVYDLAKTGQATDQYIKAILNTATANGVAISEVSGRWNQIMKADATARQGLIERFARDYGLPVKQYSSDVELAIAMNERFRGSVEAMAQTTSGTWGKVKANMHVFMQSMGILVNEIIRPFLELMDAFTDALIEGFAEAREAMGLEKMEGEFKGLRAEIQKLIPWVSMLGNLLGKFMFWTIMNVTKALKTLSGVLVRALAFWKAYRDQIRATGVAFAKDFLANLTGATALLTATTSALRGFFDAFIDAPKVPGGKQGFSKFLDDIVHAVDNFFSAVFRWIRLPKPSQFLDDIADSVDNFTKKVNIKSLVSSLTGIGRAIDDYLLKISKPGGLRSFGDDILELLVTGLRNVVAKLPTKLVGAGKGIMETILDILFSPKQGFAKLGDDILQGLVTTFKNLPKLLVGALRGGASITRIIEGALIGGGRMFVGLGDNILKMLGTSLAGLAKSPGALLKGLVSGLKGGIISALLETVTLEVVDMLPISDKLKDSLNGVLRMAFLGAGIGALFGPLGIVVGAGVGAAIGGGLEMIAPGTSKKVMDFMDATIMKGFKKAGEFFMDDVVPAFKKGFDWFQKEAVPVIKEVAKAVGDFLGPRLQKLGDFITQRLAPALNKMFTSIGQSLLPVLKEFWQLLQDPILPILGDLFVALGKLYLKFEKNVLPIIADFVIIMIEDVIPMIIKVIAWIVEHLLDKALTPLVRFIDDKVRWVLKEVLIPAFEDVDDAIENTISVFQAIWDKAKLVYNWLKDTFSWFLENVLKPAFETVMKIINGSPGVIPTFQALWDKGKEVYTWFKDTFSWFLENTLKPAFETVMKVINGDPGVISVLTALWDKAKEVYNWVKDFFIKLWENEVSNAFLAINTVANAADGPIAAFQAIWDKGKEFYDWIVNTLLPKIQGLPGNITGLISGIGATFTGIAGAIYNGMVGTIDTIIGAINSAIKGANILNPFKNIPPIPYLRDDKSYTPVAIPLQPPGSSTPPVVPQAPPGWGSEQPYMQHGGIVPGRHGTKRWVLAEAGEYFGGDPRFATPTSRNSWGGEGGGGNIYFDLRGAVIADDAAMDKFALKIGNKIAGTWFSTRRMTLPRSG